LPTVQISPFLPPLKDPPTSALHLNHLAPLPGYRLPGTTGVRTRRVRALRLVAVRARRRAAGEVGSGRLARSFRGSRGEGSGFHKFLDLESRVGGLASGGHVATNDGSGRSQKGNMQRLAHSPARGQRAAQAAALRPAARTASWAISYS
jgi:hypothetical protein